MSAKELMLRELRDSMSRTAGSQTEWQLREDDPEMDSIMEKVNQLKIDMYAAKLAASTAAAEPFLKEIDEVLRDYLLTLKLSV